MTSFIICCVMSLVFYLGFLSKCGTYCVLVYKMAGINPVDIIHECPIGLLLDGGSCVFPCPSGTFDARFSSWSTVLSESTSRCLPCHYSCQSCQGPNDYECLACFGDAILTNDGHCYLASLQAALEHAQKWQMGMTVLFFIFGLLVLCSAVYLAFTGRRHYYKDYNYEKNCTENKGLIKPYSDDEHMDVVKCSVHDDL